MHMPQPRKPSLEGSHYVAICARNKRHSGVAPAPYFLCLDTYALDGVNAKMLKSGHVQERRPADRWGEALPQSIRIVEFT
jgi:hypothetical protein